MSQKFEEEDSSQQPLSPLERHFTLPLDPGRDLPFLRVVSAAIQARKFERLAATYTDNEIPQRGKALPLAGWHYGRYRPKAAVPVLELARDDIEVYGTQGTWDSYECLATVYAVLGDVYKRTERPDEGHDATVRCVKVMREMEEIFDVQLIPDEPPSSTS